MARYHYRIVNVFAESTFGGNPLCVFENAAGLDEDSMQALARQFNLSETTFLFPSNTADARVRIFTPGFEMRFAGHPTLGSAHVVRELSGKGDNLTLEFKAGLVPVTADGNLWTLTAPSNGEPATRATGLLPAQIAQMVGLSADDLLSDPLWVDTGSDQLLVPVKHAGAVRRASPAQVEQWPLSATGRRMAYVFAFEESGKVLSRFFFSKGASGVDEDPGTGSACANLGGWLIATRHSLPASFEINQGEAVQRPCRLLLNVTAQRAIRVGGRVIELGRGYIDL